VRFTKAAAMLCKALQAEDFRPDRWLDPTARAVEDVAQGGRGIWNQTPQLGRRHALQDQ
jgi:hypothetical protein